MSDGPVFPPVRGGDDDASGNHAGGDAPQSAPPLEEDILAFGGGQSVESDEFSVADSPTSQSGDSQDEDKKGIAWWVWALIGGGIVVIAVIIIIVVSSSNKPEPLPTPTVTVTAEAPTPQGTPFARGDGSALYAAIPETGNQFTLAALRDNSSWTADRDAKEAYDATYTASIDDAEVTLDVTIGQWADADKATEAATAIAADVVGADTAQTDVTASGEVVGSLWAPTAGLPADATASALVWTNGATVIALTGPADQLQRFYDGYGL